MRRLARRTSILLLIVASLFSVGCASADRTWSSLAQPTQHISRSRVIPGNRDAVEAFDWACRFAICAQTVNGPLTCDRPRCPNHCTSRCDTLWALETHPTSVTRETSHAARGLASIMSRGWLASWFHSRSNLSIRFRSAHLNMSLHLFVTTESTWAHQVQPSLPSARRSPSQL
jgi:hypothetical protein